MNRAGAFRGGCRLRPTSRGRRCQRRLRVTLLGAAVLFAGCGPSAPVRVGSKAFTESTILGDLVVVVAEDEGLTATHKKQLGGTAVLWQALLTGDINIYAEYTGTIRESIFAGEPLADLEAIERRLADYGLKMTRPLGFSNNYALGVREEVAAELDLRTFSDLKEHPELRMGFSNEFMQRGDGWPGLQPAYGFRHRNIKGLQHNLAYYAVSRGSLDVIDVYSTDAMIERFDLRVLEDDKQHFPSYDALFIYREELEETHPELIAKLRRLEGEIDNRDMIGMNARVDVERISEKRAAADFLRAEIGTTVTVYDAQVDGGWAQQTLSLLGRVFHATMEHLLLVIISLGGAIVVSIPLGILSAKQPRFGWAIVGTAEIIQTIPGLALLILLAAGLAPTGLPIVGPLPAIIALFLYSLLPILRNTMVGIEGIPTSVKESAEALGLSPSARLRQIELPMASPIILAGVKTTAVINVGYATLGGLIGAGGYGDVIMSGLRTLNVGLMLEGAVPAALLALIVKWGFELAERYLVPKGLRLAAP